LSRGLFNHPDQGIALRTAVEINMALLLGVEHPHHEPGGKRIALRGIGLAARFVVPCRQGHHLIVASRLHETVIGDLLAGQHSNPVQVIAFNIAEGWCRDVSEEIANELADLIAIDGRDVPTWLEDFIEEHVGSRPIQLPLPLRGAA
jgi:hypothetical protein